MTPDERTLLSRFLGDLAQARANNRDEEAAAMIARAFASNPDAAYLLTQHTILSDQALQAAQSRIAELEAQLNGRGPAQGSSFLGGGGMPWQRAQPTTAVPTSAGPASGYSPFSSGGGLGSFLRNVGTTAAGVAGGEMLFEGLSGLFGGHRGFGFGGFGGGYGGPVENVTVNNYGDDASYQDSGWDGGSDGSDDY